MNLSRKDFFEESSRVKRWKGQPNLFNVNIKLIMNFKELFEIFPLDPEKTHFPA